MSVANVKVSEMAHEAAYFAGYLDAEGDIDVVVHPTYATAQIDFGQTAPEGVLAVHAHYGGSLGLYKPKEATERRKITLRISAWLSVERFLRDTLAYTLVKKSAAQLVLGQFQSANTPSAREQLSQAVRATKWREIDRATFPWQRAQRPTPTRCKQITCTRLAASRGYCKPHYDHLYVRGLIVCKNVTGPDARTFAYRRPPTPEELAYMAGFFDGDGTINLLGNGTLRVSFNQTDGTPLLLFHAIYGGSILPWQPKRNREKKRQSGQQPRHRRLQAGYRLNQREAVLQLLRDLLPLLKEKRAQAEAVLKYWVPRMPVEERRTLKTFLKAEQERELPANYPLPRGPAIQKLSRWRDRQRC